MVLVPTVLTVGIMLAVALRHISTHDVAWFKDFAAGVQSLIIGAAVLIGGVWTLYTFVSSQQTRKVQEELDTLANNRRALEISLSSKPTTFTPTGRYGLILAATIRNRGIRSVGLTLAPGSFVFSRVHMTAAGLQALNTTKSPAYAMIEPGKQTYVSDLFVQPGTEKTISTYVEVEAPGLYICTLLPLAIDPPPLPNGTPARLIGSAFIEVPPWDPKAATLPGLVE
jgi:hypothetical protein